jgi:conjugative relaxase-like TrwC/TraI family protein
MLSIGRLGVTSGAEYYLDKMANNVDDYYLGRGEAPGQWIGATAEQLGLVGQVDAESLRNLLAGLSAAGDDLGARLSADRRPGYDLTFSAPKGVSLLWAFGSEHTRDSISEAHDRAVGAVLDQLSAETCFVRRGAGGRQLREANGFIGAAFRHRSSRAGDPQLHTHVVVPNLVQGADGRWSAPDGRHLYAWQKTAGSLYQSALRAELTPLGLRWQVRRNGLGELADIPKNILRAFSKRRVDIEAAMDERDVTSASAAETAALATRARKPDETAPLDLLREGWRAQLAEIPYPDGEGGHHPATPGDLVLDTMARGSAALPDQVEAVFSVLAGEARVSLDDWEIDDQLAPDTRAMPVTLFGSTFSRRDAICAVARAFDVTPARAVALTSEFLERESVHRVLADAEAGARGDADQERMEQVRTEQVRTRSGRLIPATSGDRRYTTTELLAAEKRIVRSAVERIGERTAQVAPALVDQVLGRHPHLDGEQADGVRALLTSGNGYDLIIGQAGTGKSTMLTAARMGWEEAGFRVIGAAVAARTAADLETGTGIPSSSLTQILADLRESGGLTSRHVIVVDEASMVGSRSLDRLRHHVDVAGAKLVLVGDNRQLSSIDAGGALRTLSKELGGHVVTLTANRRQAEPGQQWERDALVALREGNVAPAVHAYADHGRVTIAGTIDEARQRLIDDWWAVHHEHTTAILAVRRVDVRTLNELARARRQAAGELGQEIRVGEKAFSIGDRVIFERNQRVREVDRLDRGSGTGLVRLRNGTFATVVGVIDPTGGDPAHNVRTREGDVTLGQGDVAASEFTGVDELEAIHEREVHREAVSTLVVELDDGSRAVLPRDYAEHSTSLGYALTVFRSQGITVDHAFGLGGDTLFQEAGYTQLSRGRLSNNLYVAAPDCPRWEVGHHSEDTTQRDHLDALVEALSSSREQIMAQDHLPSWPAISPYDLDTVYRQHADLGRWLAEHAPADRTDQLAETWNRDYAARTAGREVQADREDLASLAQAQRQRNDWVARHQHEITTWSQLDGTIRRYEYRLGQAAAFARPEHVTSLLGPLPERITETERWQVAAGAIEAYRSRWNIAEGDTVDTAPTNPEQRAHWDTMAATLASAGFISPGGTSGQEADAPWLASLWERVRDLDRARDEANLERVAAVAPPPFSWSSSRDSGYDHGRDDGFGL